MRVVHFVTQPTPCLYVYARLNSYLDIKYIYIYRHLSDAACNPRFEYLGVHARSGDKTREIRVIVRVSVQRCSTYLPAVFFFFFFEVGHFRPVWKGFMSKRGCVLNGLGCPHVFFALPVFYAFEWSLWCRWRSSGRCRVVVVVRQFPNGI